MKFQFQFQFQFRQKYQFHQFQFQFRSPDYKGVRLFKSTQKKTQNPTKRITESHLIQGLVDCRVDGDVGQREDGAEVLLARVALAPVAPADAAVGVPAPARTLLPWPYSLG